MRLRFCLLPSYAYINVAMWLISEIDYTDTLTSGWESVENINLYWDFSDPIQTAGQYFKATFIELWYPFTCLQI